MAQRGLPLHRGEAVEGGGQGDLGVVLGGDVLEDAGHPGEGAVRQHRLGDHPYVPQAAVVAQQPQRCAGALLTLGQGADQVGEFVPVVVVQSPGQLFQGQWLGSRRTAEGRVGALAPPAGSLGEVVLERGQVGQPGGEFHHGEAVVAAAGVPQEYGALAADRQHTDVDQRAGPTGAVRGGQPGGPLRTSAGVRPADEVRKVVGGERDQLRQRPAGRFGQAHGDPAGGGVEVLHV